MIRMGSDHGSVVAQFVLPAPKKERLPKQIQEVEGKLFNGEHQKPLERRSEIRSKLPDSKSAPP